MRTLGVKCCVRNGKLRHIGDSEPTGSESLAVPKYKKNAALMSDVLLILMRHRGFEPRTT